MGSLEANDDKLFQNSIKYLHNLSTLHALNVPALKSFYSTKGRLMELRKSIYLPPNLTRTSVRCPKCFLNLVDGPASYRIKAEQKKSKFARRLLAKSQSDKPMTKYQRKYLEQMDNFSGNHLAITCKFCRKESLIKLSKPKATIHPKVSTVLSQNKKKNRKRDKFCGLRQEAVLSLAPQNIRNLNITSLGIANNKGASRFKLSKKENQNKGKQVEFAKNKVIKNKNLFKKKNKSLSKLSEFINNSNKLKGNSSSTLKQFLLSMDS